MARVIDIDGAAADRATWPKVAPASSAGSGRDAFVDTWRGVAVLLVVHHHYTDRVPPQTFGDVGLPLLPFHSGKVGVLVFFLISGYLIAGSLVHCRDLADFLAKRLSRIWPLFAVASVLVFLFLQVVPPPIVPDGFKPLQAEPTTVADLLGSVLFLEDIGFRWVDGAYWSILVELKFYLLLGLTAAAWPRSFDTKFAFAGAVLGLAALAATIFPSVEHRAAARLLNGLLIAQYLPFFAVGVLLSTRRTGPLLTANLLLAVALAAIKIDANPNFQVAATLRFLFVLIALLSLDALLLRERALLFLGRYSYAIYLFHQMVGLSLIALLAPALGINGAMLAAFAFILTISVVMSQLFEWRWRGEVAGLLRRAFALAGLRRLRLGDIAVGVRAGSG